MTKYQHAANLAAGRPCIEPCGWCLREHVERLQRAIVSQDEVMAKRFETQSKLLDAVNVRLREQEARVAEMRSTLASENAGGPSW